MPDAPDKKAAHTLDDHVYGIDLAHTHDGYADHDHDFPDEIPLEENPIWIAGPRHAQQRRHRHRLGGDADHLLAHQSAAPRRGPVEPLFRGVARDAVPVRGVADPLSQRGTDRRGASSATSSMTPMQDAGIAPDDIDTGAVILTGEALRRENAKAIAGDHRREGRRIRLRHRRPSHGGDARRLWLRSSDRIERGRQAHPQHRHRRRHHQARHRREREGDGDRGRACRRAPAGGR